MTITATEIDDNGIPLHTYTKLQMRERELEREKLLKIQNKNQRQWFISQTKELRRDGLSQRQIANELRIGASTVNKYLQL